MEPIRQTGNARFLEAIAASFRAFVACGTSRSTDKLKPLHGAVAEDLAARLGDDFQIRSQGFGAGREGIIRGRYVAKKTDITVFHCGTPVAAVGVKFVMQNYSQNSNNYFENMLGETANIRCAGCPYFQIFVILDRLPYYKRDKTISRWETVTDHNIEKYRVLSHDDPQANYHIPDKTLIYVVHQCDSHGLDRVTSLPEYMDFYSGQSCRMEVSNLRFEDFGDALVINDYEAFAREVERVVRALPQAN